MKKSYILNLPFDKEHELKCWIRCPYCWEFFLLDDGKFTHVNLNGCEKNIMFCLKCVNEAKELLSTKVLEVIEKYPQKDLFKDIEGE